MSTDSQFIDYLLETLQAMGPVSARKMFGGHGIFLDKRMFALVADNELYLKADADNQQRYLDAGLGPFQYEKNGKLMSMSYYHAPEEALEVPEELLDWARHAYAAALRVKK